MHADRPLTAAETRRPEVQLLRAIAVMAVVLFHLWPDLVPGGYVGVDVFFVISGFLITAHLLREVGRTGSIRLREFWARRARRLLPAALLVLGVTLVGVLLWAPQTVWASFFRSIGASALYVENWQLAVDAVDYLASDAAASPAQHYWSLSVEEQFYLAWPLLILLAIWLAARLTKGGVRARGVAIGVTLAIVVAASFVASVVLTPLDPAVSYFSTPLRAWEFGLGGLLALAPAVRLPGWAHVVASVVGLAGIVASCFIITTATLFPGYAAALPVIATALVIWAGTPANAYRHVLAFRPFQWLGDVSYSAYLWHWPPIILLPFILGGPLTAVQKVAILVATLLAAWLTKRFVEDPVRTGRLARAKSWRTYLATLVGMALIVAPSAAALVYVQAQAGHDEQIVEEVAGSCFGAPALTAERAACAEIAELDGVLVPSPALLRDDVSLIYSDECRTPQKSVDLRECVFAPASGEPTATVMLIGDSHAAQWYPVLDAIAGDRQWDLRVLFKSECPFADGAIVHDEQAVVEACSQWNADVIDRLAELRPDAVVTSTQTRIEFADAAGEPSQEAAVEAFAKQWQAVTDLGIELVVIEDTPTVSNDELDCAAAPKDLAWDCVRPLAKAFARNPGTLAAAAELVPAATYLDFTRAMRTDEGCPAVLGHVIAYRDTSSHLSNTFASTLTGVIGPRLVAAVLGTEAEPAA